MLHYFIIIIIIIIVGVVVVGVVVVVKNISWHFSSRTSGEPHDSGFKFLIVALSL
jgi:NADH:ubiquinone oxidoreductase subunit 3 (subunit A)